MADFCKKKIGCQRLEQGPHELGVAPEQKEDRGADINLCRSAAIAAMRFIEDAWPELPEHVRSSIRTLIDGALASRAAERITRDVEAVTITETPLRNAGIQIEIRA